MDPNRTVVVYVGGRVVDMVDQAAARGMERAPNSQVIRRRKDQRIVRVILEEHGNDWDLNARMANPRKYSDKHEHEDNPTGVWRLRRIARRDRGVFVAVLQSCLRRRAA